MKIKKLGFTIIEVSLFIALSGMIMVGVISISTIQIARQRYNDSVNDFAEYLRTVYNDVQNVSTDKPINGSTSDVGRTTFATYGKLLVFGADAPSKHTIYTYDVVGTATTSANVSSSNTLVALNDLGANVAYDASTNPGVPSYVYYRLTPHTVVWDATLENPFPAAEATSDAFVGLVLIVRSPASGAIHTYWYKSQKVNDYNFSSAEAAAASFPKLLSSDGDGLRSFLQNSESSSVDFCVDSPDNNYKNRRDIRISAYAANSSAVFTVAQDDDSDSKCSGRGL